jgi:hypothetical protein
VAEHDGTVDGAGRCGRPAARDPGIEQLICSWAMVPHGDRIDGAKSGRVEHVVALSLANHDVMREFVLNDDLDDVGAMCATPREHVFERA